MKTLITILLCTWIINLNAQAPLYEEKIKGNHANYATGTQTVVTGRIFTTVDGKITPVPGIITIKGYNKEIKTNEEGFYWVEISELAKSKKKIIVSCKAKNYKTQEQVIKIPFTNEYKINFEFMPKRK